MIPVLVAAGHRCIAPDLVGFGRSDKPSEQADYSYQRHVDWMSEALFDRLDLRDITARRPGLGRPHRAPAARGATRSVCPGGDRQHGAPDRRPPHERGVLGLEAVRARLGRFPNRERPLEGSGRHTQPRRHRGLRRTVPGRVLQGGRPRTSRRWCPSLRTTRRTTRTAPPGRSWVASRGRSSARSATVTRSSWAESASSSSTSRGPPALHHRTIEGAGHFLQEDKGPELARVIATFIGQT